ncbi:MAG: adenosylcobinamide-GDP ribazoletransferase, partial [Candidatus Lindowbacteria bacterium]|nr:adenosylcobinamide-GDP ribazoletransferase [Candidatus Lindowbacteria bacterium]
MFSNFRSALTFLTVLPFPKTNAKPSSDTLGNTLKYYPLVGLILGLILAGTGMALLLFVPPMLTALIITVLWALLTGGLHLDGVSDTCDGLFSSRTPERSLEIMKDSHIGTMGV